MNKAAAILLMITISDEYVPVKAEDARQNGLLGSEYFSDHP